MNIVWGSHLLYKTEYLVQSKNLEVVCVDKYYFTTFIFITLL